MSVTAAQGFTAAGVSAGLKRSGKPDLAIVINHGPEQVAAGVFTRNRITAAPVVWSRQALAGHQGTPAGQAHAVVLNSGSANACTGPDGAADTAATAAYLAEKLGCSSGQVQVCSTGVIGTRIDMPTLLAGIDLALEQTGSAAENGHAAAQAIMTTDTVRKEDSLSFATEQGRWTIGGMIKGVGMLAPGLATVLCVITTDAVVSASTAQQALEAGASRTLNRINSDGCMSTNDTVLMMSSGASRVAPSQSEFDDAVAQLMGMLGRRLVADAEGASHDIAITITGAGSEAAAELAARTVSSSNLLKCAIAGNDPNWGRVLAQLGTVPASECSFDPDAVDVTINGVTVFRHGALGEDRDLVDMTPRETHIDIDLNYGDFAATVWTNDLTHEYVSINGDYTT